MTSRWRLLTTLAFAVLPGLWASPPLETDLIRNGAVWSYLDTGADAGTAWRGPGFDDSKWRSGSAQLGFGDGDESTVVRSTSASSAKILTTYFRHAFQVKSRAGIKHSRLRVLADDGAIVYLNGTEIARINMPTGTVGYRTLAKTTLHVPQETMFRTVIIDHRLLLKGRNVLAVEVHQSSSTSSDLSFDLQLLASDGHAVVTRGPYLQTGTSTSGIVRWRTDWATRSALWLGLDKNLLTQRVLDNQLRTEHRVVLTGLLPKTRYFYAVGNRDDGILAGGDDTHYFDTSPRPGVDTPTRVWVVGDSGTGDINAAMVRDSYLRFAGSRRADLFLMLGDNAYRWGTDDEYQRSMFEMYSVLLRNTFVWSTLGNHDAAIASSSLLTGPYYEIFDPPRKGEAGGVASGTEAYYSFDYGQIHFICLNSQDVDRLATGSMMKWLKADLAATSARWLIAFFHHPPYSKGTHDSDDPIDSGGRMRDMRKVFLPVLESGGVDLVLSGHSHSYERSYLLNGHYGVSSQLSKAMILDAGDGRPSGDGAYAKPSLGPAGNEGAVYVVAGCSGKLSSPPLNHPAMRVSLSTLGSLVLDISGNRLDATFVNHQNLLQDSFTIHKGLERSLRRIEPIIAIGSGGTQTLVLDAGVALAGGRYQVASSFSTAPGFKLGALHVPLNQDPWFYLVLQMSNSAVFRGTHGVLDARGQGTASIVLPAIPDPSLVGTELYHAFVVADSKTGWRLASNTVKLTLVY